MSEIVIELIGLVIEVLFDVATSGSKSHVHQYNKDYVQKEKRYSRIYGDQKADKPIISKPLITSASHTEKKEFTKRNSKQEEIVSNNYVYATAANQVKLEILLLSYMFKEDDGRISGTEKRAIKKHFSKFKGALNTQDLKEIKAFDNMDKSLINIRAFISQNDVSEGDISDAIRTLKEIERDSNRYRSVISRIESSLLEVMGY